MNSNGIKWHHIAMQVGVFTKKLNNIAVYNIVKVVRKHLIQDTHTDTLGPGMDKVKTALTDD